MLCADEILARTDELQKFKQIQSSSSSSVEAKQIASV
jgi:hypothetical protein